MFRKLWERFDPNRTETDSISTLETQTEAIEARKHAEKGHREAVEGKPRVREVVNALKEQRDRNHFGEMLERTMRGVG